MVAWKTLATPETGAQQLMGDVGSHLPNCQTNFVIILFVLSHVHLINTTAYHSGGYERAFISFCKKCSIMNLLNLLFIRANENKSQHKEQEVYYPIALFMGCGVVERHLEMAKPTNKDRHVSLLTYLGYTRVLLK